MRLKQEIDWTLHNLLKKANLLKHRNKKMAMIVGYL